jgi:hypothetical protein
MKLLFASAIAILLAQQGSTTRTTLDGVYSEEQLKRGTALFAEECSRCHGHDLTGGEEAPALFGAGFMANWNGLTVGDLSERIRLSMPPDNPSRLSRQQNVDILSLILRSNGFPSGKAELETRLDALKQIKIQQQ